MKGSRANLISGKTKEASLSVSTIRHFVYDGVHRVTSMYIEIFAAMIGRLEYM